MKHIRFKAQIIFEDIAIHFFNFPIESNNIRISFWLYGQEFSTPSEVIINEKISINSFYNVIIETLLYEENQINRLKKGESFCLGLYPEVIAKGKIIEILDINDT